MRNVRIYFSKTGDAKYISHLDLMRCMMRAVSRAGIPISYTEGFNPRPYMNFAMPLSLGIEGLREILDIRVEDEMTDAELKSALEQVLKGFEDMGFDLGDLGDIYLHWVLPYDATNEVCKVILQSFFEVYEDDSVNKKNYETITTTKLSESGLDFNAISLSSFIDSTTLDMICNAINPTAVNIGCCNVGAITNEYNIGSVHAIIAPIVGM
jgi:uncharacterized protein (DUF2344 family)